MDVVLYKGTLQKSKVSFGLLTKKKALVFEKGGKYLIPKDRQKKVIDLPDDIELSKIKKNTKETTKAIDFYLSHPELSTSTYCAFLIEYYIEELSNKDALFEELNEDGKALLLPIYEKILKLTYYKKGASYADYYKESKVITRFAMMDFELIFGTLIKDFDSFLFKGTKPVSIYPLRYSTREVTEEDLEKMQSIHSQNIAKWFEWRKVLRKSPYLYNFMIHWLFQILESLYPEDQEDIKGTVEDAERIEIFSNPEVLTALQQGVDFEAEDFSKVTLNKHILYYFSMQFLFDEHDLSFKKYKQITSFDYQDIFISMANIYASMPFFTNFNPLFSMIAGGLIEWIDQGLSFQALRGNSQMDPYNIIPNALSFLLAIVSSKAKKLKDKKYLLAKTLEKILTPEILKEGLSWVKQSQMLMQGENPTQEPPEVTDKDVEEKQKAIEEKIKAYIKELKVAPVKKKEYNLVIEELGMVDVNFEGMKGARDKYLNIDAKHKKHLSDFQKDFLLSVQLFEKDPEILNAISKLFDFINSYIMLGNSSALFGLSLLLWMISINKAGSLDWLNLTEPIAMKPKEECDSLVKICVRYNTVLTGFKIKGYPLIETTAPALIAQTSQNLSELLLAKDISKEKKYPLYESILKNMEKVFS